jgi:hypothetical protein
MDTLSTRDVMGRDSPIEMAKKKLIDKPEQPLGFQYFSQISKIEFCTEEPSRSC